MGAVVRVVDVVKNYYLEGGTVCALRGVSLTVEEGDFVATSTQLFDEGGHHALGTAVFGGRNRLERRRELSYAQFPSPKKKGTPRRPLLTHRLVLRP